MRSCIAAKRALASVPRHTMTASRHEAVSDVESIKTSRKCRVQQICTWQMFEICVSPISYSGSPSNTWIGLSADVPTTL